MGSKLRQIKKRATRFNNALEAIEKHIEVEAAKAGETTVTQPFDLAKTAEIDEAQRQEEKRKARNKRKAEKRKLKKK